MMNSSVAAVLTSLACLACASVKTAQPPAGTQAPTPQMLFKTTTLKIAWPAPAPDGSALVFSGHDGQRWSLYRLKLGSQQPEPLTAGLKGHATRAVYSHDGRKIAFRLSQGGKGTPGAVWVLDLATQTSRPFQAATEGAWDAYPEWFADGRRVVVTRKRSQTQSHDLVVLGEDNHVQVITDTPHYDGKPTLSPDGRRAVFPSNRGKVITLWQVDVAAGESSATQLTQKEARAPDWSPDGRWIAFQSERAGAFDIYVLNLADGRQCQVTHGMKAKHPEWSADGRWLYFTVGGPKGTLQRMDMAAWFKANTTNRHLCTTEFGRS